MSNVLYSKYWLLLLYCIFWNRWKVLWKKVILHKCKCKEIFKYYALKKKFARMSRRLFNLHCLFLKSNVRILWSHNPTRQRNNLKRICNNLIRYHKYVCLFNFWQTTQNKNLRAHLLTNDVYGVIKLQTFVNSSHILILYIQWVTLGHNK